MTTTTATVYMGQDAAAKAVGIVYLNVVADGQTIDSIIVKDGADLVRRADKAMAAKGYFRFGGYETNYDGDLKATVKF